MGKVEDFILKLIKEKGLRDPKVIIERTLESHHITFQEAVRKLKLVVAKDKSLLFCKVPPKGFTPYLIGQPEPKLSLRISYHKSWEPQEASEDHT